MSGECFSVFVRITNRKEAPTEQHPTKEEQPESAPSNGSQAPEDTHDSIPCAVRSFCNADKGDIGFDRAMHGTLCAFEVDKSSGVSLPGLNPP